VGIGDNGQNGGSDSALASTQSHSSRPKTTPTVEIFHLLLNSNSILSDDRPKQRLWTTKILITSAPACTIAVVMLSTFLNNPYLNCPKLFPKTTHIDKQVLCHRHDHTRLNKHHTAAITVTGWHRIQITASPV
jgi:hypothetical protein